MTSGAGAVEYRGREGARTLAPDARSHRSAFRASVRRPAGALAVLAVAAAMSISGAQAATHPPRASVVPALRVCRADQLRIRRSAQVGGLLGTLIVSVDFTNVSGTSCRVDGFPRVQVLDSRHRRVAVAFVHGALSPKEPQRATPTVLVAHTGRGTFGLSFLDHPAGARGLSICRRFNVIDAVLPGESRERSTAVPGEYEVCGGHPRPVIDVSAFGPGTI